VYEKNYMKNLKKYPDIKVNKSVFVVCRIIKNLPSFFSIGKFIMFISKL